MVRASPWADRLRNWVFDPVKGAERNFVYFVLGALIARSLHAAAEFLSQEIILVPTPIEPSIPIQNGTTAQVGDQKDSSQLQSRMAGTY